MINEKMCLFLKKKKVLIDYISTDVNNQDSLVLMSLKCVHAPKLKSLFNKLMFCT